MVETGNVFYDDTNNFEDEGFMIYLDTDGLVIDASFDGVGRQLEINIKDLVNFLKEKGR